MTYGVDYPWTKPAPAALATAGVSFVMRYLSTDPSKNLSRSEANSLAAVGIWCGVVWETTAGRALDGRAAGAADAREAVRQAAACGMPDGRPVYFAVDTDTTWSKVEPYFRGVRDVLRAEQVGVYGGIRIVAAAADSGLACWYWQAEAWSGGRWEPRAHIRQAGMTRIGGVQVDNNTAVTGDFGQWMPGRTPTAITEEDELATTLSQERSDQWNSMIWGLKNTCEATQRQVTALQGAVTALSGLLASQQDGLTAEQITEAVRQGIKDGLEHDLVHVQVDIAGASTTAPAAPKTT